MFNDEGEDPQNDADGGIEGNETEQPVYKITSSPETYHLLVGGNVRLPCSLQPKDDSGQAVISWTKGDSETLILDKFKVFVSRYPENKFHIDKPSYDLIIRDAMFNDTGRYTCQVQQTDKVSLTHTVIVEEPAHIINPETTTMDSVDIDTDDNKARIVSFTASDTAPLEGSPVLFNCSTRGTPTPSVIWSRQRRYRNSTESLKEANGIFNGSTFLMPNVTVQDSGTYYCYAVNTIGNDDTKSAIAEVSITVYGKPRLHAHRPVINSAIGIEAELTCFSRDGPHHITWLRNGQPLTIYVPSKYSVRKTETEDGSKSTLLVTPTDDEDFGVFTCEAANSFGIHSQSVELTQRPLVEQLNGEGQKLSWTVHSHQPLELIQIHLTPLGEGDSLPGSDWVNYTVPAEDLVGNDTSSRHMYDLVYELKDSKPGQYQVTVQVKNSKAWSANSDPITIKVLEREMETEPENERIQTASASIPASKTKSTVVVTTSVPIASIPASNVESTSEVTSVAAVLATGTGRSYATQPEFFLNAIMMYLLVRMM